MTKILLLISLSFLNLSLGISSVSSCQGFLPQNNLRIPVKRATGYFSDLPITGLSEQQFNKILDLLEEIYSPVVAKKNARLVIKKQWSSEVVNAEAQRDGKVWTLLMHGGLARHAAMTEDSFAMIACHELGHHLGGAVKNPFLNTWSTGEGGSDYFAVLKCFRFYAEKTSADYVRPESLEDIVLSSCEKQFNTHAERDVCIRSMKAGQVFAELFRDASESKTSFLTPDKTQVQSTRVTHPDSQCRLDTYFNGALCTVDKTEAVDDKDYHVGTCTALTHKAGLRPRCWFRPQE